VGIWPVPLRETDCGLPVALSVKEIDAARAPLVVGEKVTLTLQEALAARLFEVTGHVSFEMEKSPAFAPAKPMAENVTGLLPVLVTVTDCAALVVPVFCNEYVRLAGLKLSVKVGATPVPLRPTDCGLPVALSVNEIEAVREPAAVGVNFTLTLHAALEARLPAPTGQVSLEMLKSPAFAPVSAIEENVTALFPVLVTVTL
jgi:hypothetical protein